MDNDLSTKSDIELSPAFTKEAVDPSIWHRIHVYYDASQDALAYIIGQGGGAGGYIVGGVFDFADMLTEYAGGDLFEGSALHDFPSIAHDWAEENIGVPLAKMMIPTTTLIDAFAGKAEILDETDQTIYSVTKNGTIIVADAAIVTGAIILSGGTVMGALSTTAGAAKTAAVATAGVLGVISKTTVVGTGLLVVLDQATTDGLGEHIIFTTAEKFADATGHEKLADAMDFMANLSGPASFDTEEKPDVSMGDAISTNFGTKKDPDTDDGESSLLKEILALANEKMPRLGRGLSSLFNWLGNENSMGAMIGIGIATFLGGNWALDKIIGDSFLSGIISIGLAVMAAYTLPSMFNEAAKGDPATTPSKENEITADKNDNVGLIPKALVPA